MKTRQQIACRGYLQARPIGVQYALHQQLAGKLSKFQPAIVATFEGRMRSRTGAAPRGARSWGLPLSVGTDVRSGGPLPTANNSRATRRLTAVDFPELDFLGSDGVVTTLV